MKWIKSFNESIGFSHGRLTREDLEDYFLEFIDDGDFIYDEDEDEDRSSYIDDENDEDDIPFIRTNFYFNEKYRRINNNDILNTYTKMLSKIYSVVTRWNLDFELTDSGFYIKQPVPQDIIDNSLDGRKLMDFIFGGRKFYFFSNGLQVGDDGFFYANLQLNQYFGGSSSDGRWRKKDWNFFTENEDNIISEVEKKFPIKCQYLGKEEENFYKFKLLC